MGKLRNMWNGDEADYKWISFRNDGTWLRATYDENDAMPILFEKQTGGYCDGYYKMQNLYPGHDGWISFRDKDKAIRATYSKRDAMCVSLYPNQHPLSLAVVSRKQKMS